MSSSPLGRPAPHESARLHVTGAARYVDDLPEPPGLLVAQVVAAPHARARILRRDGSKAREYPGIHAVLFADAVPGDNRIGPIVHDEPVLAEGEVFFRGQSVALVVGESYEACRAAAALVAVEYEPLPAILDIQSAIAAGSFHGTPHRIERGDVDAALGAAAVRVAGEAASGGQDHFYLETQAAIAIPGENATFHVLSSTQHPTEIQKMAAHVLGLPSSSITCEVPRLGGGFGGKESQATQWGVLAALGAWATGRPVKVWLNRDQDMEQTGKRHPFWSRYEAGFDEDGRIVALRAEAFSDGGWTQDLSIPVLDRALFHMDNAYFLPALRFEGQVCLTHLPSNTAFRGFGGPQGMVVIEAAINRYAELTGQDPAIVRARSFYGDSPRDVAPYGQRVPAPRIARIWEELAASSEYDARRARIEAFNATSPWVKRGIGFQPVKFGISFTNALLNQAGAYVVVYADGSVQLNHSGTEMGQGLYTKMLAVCAHELGVPLSRVRQMPTSTEKVPNTSPTAASSGTDLNGQAVLDACRQLRERLAPVAADILGGADPAALVFADDAVGIPGGPSVGFPQLCLQAWIRRVPLAAAGYYATPGVAYDRLAGRGTPFFYYAYGGCVAEVEVSGLTGEHRLLRADILHDVGDSLSPAIDKGQVEGAFVQGAGWLTCEEVLYDAQGRLLTHAPSTYKIPAVGDAPLDFRVELLDRARQDGVVGGSKAVGEPPFMLAISVVTALHHAIGAWGEARTPVDLALPATPEAILRAVEARRAQSAAWAAR